MTTHATLKSFRKKVNVLLEKVKVEIRSAEDHLRYLQDSRVAFLAQIQTLEDLMNTTDNPPTIEIPMAEEDNIEELFEKRLGNPDQPEPDEMRRLRQEGVYKREALGMVDQLDELNNSTQDPELDTA